MRPIFACLTLVAGLIGFTPAIHAQYAYPPMAYPPSPVYGYPPMPAQQPYYGPNPMYLRPAQYYPRPMQPAPRAPMYYPAAQSTGQPRVYNFGPLPQESVAPIVTTTPMPTTTMSIPMYEPMPVAAAPTPAPPVSRTLSNLFKSHHPPKTEPIQEACGPQGCPTGSCGEAACGPSCGPVCDACRPVAVPMPRPHPRGHCFGELGMMFLVPYTSNRNSFGTTTGGTTTVSQFSRELDYAPRVSLGYVCHNGWGVRGDFWFLSADANANTTNSVLTTNVSTANAAPFMILSPSATLTSGIGADQFTATQSIRMQVGAIEAIKEGCAFGTTFLCGFGARYGHIEQGYSANRTNTGGIAGTTVVGSDVEIVNVRSRYEGIGPTLSIDAVCPVYSNCLSIYSNVRGTALFGVERFSQDYSLQTMRTDAGVNTSTSLTNSTRVSENRTAYGIEAELGLQFGKRYGPCYLFTRVGAVAQRWWDVGSPVSNNGNLSFLGGTLSMGLTY